MMLLGSTYAMIAGPACYLQGDLYVTLAYSKDAGNLIKAPPGDSCEALTGINDKNNNFAQVPQLVQSITSNDSSSVPGQSLKKVFEEIFDVVLASPLVTEFAQAVKPYASSKHSYVDYHESFFAGAALVFMGETSISSLKDGLHVKETGMPDLAGCCTADACKS